MKITKLGHCCLVIEEAGKTIVTDPGMYTDRQNELAGVDVVVITHEHQDHFHVDSVKKILQNNPQAAIITNTAVGKLLEKEGIAHQVVDGGQFVQFGGMQFAGYGSEHADIYRTVPRVQNTGYFIGGRLFYPGDAFFNPDRPVEILALPVAGPWMRIADALDYALAVRPKHMFPVHDAIMKSPAFVHAMVKNIVSAEGLDFTVPPEDGVMEF